MPYFKGQQSIHCWHNIEIMEWTPCSLDRALNLNMICMIRMLGVDKTKVAKTYFTSVEQLIVAIKEAWMEIDQSSIDKMFDDFRYFVVIFHLWETMIKIWKMTEVEGCVWRINNTILWVDSRNSIRIIIALYLVFEIESK